MLLKLLAAGTKLPQWIQQGYREYAQRMPRECRLELFEVALGGRSDAADKAKADECERMLRAIRREDYVVALDVAGKQFDTAEAGAPAAGVDVRGARRGNSDWRTGRAWRWMSRAGKSALVAVATHIPAHRCTRDGRRTALPRCQYSQEPPLSSRLSPGLCFAVQQPGN